MTAKKIRLIIKFLGLMERLEGEAYRVDRGGRGNKAYRLSWVGDTVWN